MKPSDHIPLTEGVGRAEKTTAIKATADAFCCAPSESVGAVNGHSRATHPVLMEQWVQDGSCVSAAPCVAKDGAWVTVHRRGARKTLESAESGRGGSILSDSLPHAGSSGLCSLVVQEHSGWYDCLPVEEVGGFEGSNKETLSNESVGSGADADTPRAAVCGGVCGICSDEPSSRTWKRRKRRKLVGALLPHVLYLQFIFRRTRRVRPGCWARGGMRGFMWWRPRTTFGCGGGIHLAAYGEFREQQTLAREAMAWYRNYTRLLQRLTSGQTPTALVTFCSQGGTSEGVRRAGGAAHGQDLRAQPNYEKRFGSETFSRGDSADASEVRVLRRKLRAFFTFASPPCKSYSSALMRGQASEAPLIDATRDACRAAGGLYAIENVVGAKTDLRGDAALLRGAYFGERVDRPRLFETNFKLHVDEALRVPGNRLRARTCLGERRRWRRLDPFGRPEQVDCCRGNIWAVQGDKPLRCTREECAAAMGIDSGHMDYEGLSQAIPPSYAQYVFGQACMREVEKRFGFEVITFDEMLADPSRARRRMAHWLQGAGGASPEQGIEFEAPTKHEREGHVEAKAGVPPARTAEEREESPACAEAATAPSYVPHHTDGSEDAALPPTEARVAEAEWRELEYSWAGGYDAVVGTDEAVRSVKPVGAARMLQWPFPNEAVRDSNVLCDLSSSQAKLHAARLARLSREWPGTRFTVPARGAWSEALLKSLGFECVRRVMLGEPAYATGDQSARSRHPRSFWACGSRQVLKAEPVDYDALEAEMDPLDRTGAVQEPKTAKTARSYAPIPWEKERWDVGLPEELDRIMAKRGVGIYPVEELGPTEVPFYRWASNEGLLKSILEADRAILAGAMEYVPASRLAEVEAVSTIHPWTIVDQGGGKWRLCHDYSVGTNKRVATAPFALPSVWDVLPEVTESSCFAKYDIRDGFWHVPIADDSKKRLVVRHPGTGRLIWATRLPFGYVESPRLFCGVTEAIMARLRRRAAGRDISFYCFVDDVLVRGGNEELTRIGMQMLEDEFKALGVEWAPHKKRGPCRCIEFLGLLLSNVPGSRGVTVTRKRLGSLRAEMAKWAERKPSWGSLEAEPKELASFLGKLVFASQVVRGGRTYMQGMLSQFKGLVVDWRRGAVQPADGKWRPLQISQAFWRDLEWWEQHLEHRSLVPMGDAQPAKPVVITGTDASGWGTGQAVWLDGSREESVLRFTAAEKRRPINWRELLGVVRVAIIWGHRLKGRTVLIETDNMAARGAASKLASKAADMQELVRRLLELSERHGFEVKVTHTPGVKLERPDQTSRGDPVEESRTRVGRDLFDQIEARWGPFDGLIGAERELARVGRSQEGSASTWWVHPTYNTVGSALRRAIEVLVQSNHPSSRAVALVPDDDSPQWSSLLKHGVVVGRLEQGHVGMERLGLSRWQPSRVVRPMRFVLFPRAAGMRPRRVQLTHREGAEVVTPGDGQSRTRVAGEGYSLSSDGESLMLPVMPGSFVYSLPKEGGFGALYQVTSAYGSGSTGALWGSYGLRVQNKTAQKMKVPLIEIPFKYMGKQNVHQPDPADLWTVDHLVRVRDDMPRKKSVLVEFDFEMANSEIRRAGGAWRDPNGGWTMLDEDSSDDDEPPELEERLDSDEEFDAGERLRELRAGIASAGEPLSEQRAPAGEMVPQSASKSVASGYSPFVTGVPPSPDGLSDVVANLDMLHLEQSPLKSGPEGRVAPTEFRDRGEEAAGVAGEVTQPNQYASMACAGCGSCFKLGEPMVSAAGAFVHNQPQCRSLAAAKVLTRSEEERRALGEPETFYGVFSEEVGETGVYSSWEEVARIQEPAHASIFGVRVEPFGTYAEAQAFIKLCTEERAKGVEPKAREVKGSLMMRARQSERLHPNRVSSIVRCVDGGCGQSHDISVSTPCRGGCGRQVHMETCGMLGRGYAAIGNFTCYHCRLIEVTNEPTEATDQLVNTVQRTMVLEMSQGKETTAAGYAEFSALEERYALGMGMVLADNALKMPRHSEEAFKNFLTWFVQDAGRARSVESMVRTAGALMVKTQLTDHTKSKSVKAHIKELMSGASMEHEPSTTATPNMLKMIVEKLVDERFSDPFIAARDKVQVIVEGVGGCRIGEVVGGGDRHGLLANNTCILEDPNAEQGSICSTVVEMKLEHSKTGYSRYLDIAGKTQISGIECAKLLQQYWRLAGFTVKEEIWAGVRVFRPDFWVVRVGLFVSDEEFRHLERLLRGCTIPCVKQYVQSTMVAAKQRKGQDEEDKKYINVARGDSSVINATAATAFWGVLRDAGFSVSIVPGPLLLSTTGGVRPKQKTMPISDSTVSGRIGEWLVTAHRRLNPLCRAAGYDMDLELEPGQMPHWTPHSLRRLANTTAKRWMVKMNITEAMVDLYFGWNEKLLKKAMQNHYNSFSVRERMKTATITGMM